MTGLCQQTHKGKRRKTTPEYKKIDGDKCKVRKFLDMLKDENLEAVPERGGMNVPLKYAGYTRMDLSKELDELTKEQMKTRQSDPCDPDFRRLQYTRYADDFLLGFVGSKEEAEAIMEEVKGFLGGTLQLECSEEKTKIVHHSKGAIFLGYHLKTHALKADADRARSQMQYGRKIMRRRWNGSGITLLIPEQKVRDFVKRKRC